MFVVSTGIQWTHFSLPCMTFCYSCSQNAFSVCSVLASIILLGNGEGSINCRKGWMPPCSIQRRIPGKGCMWAQRRAKGRLLQPGESQTSLWLWECRIMCEAPLGEWGVGFLPQWSATVEAESPVVPLVKVNYPLQQRVSKLQLSDTPTLSHLLYLADLWDTD